MTTLVLADVTSVDTETAKEKVQQYRAAVKQTRRAEDAAIASAYSIVARGKRVISLNETIRQGGFDDHGRPRLAVSRADAQRCSVHTNDVEDLVFYDSRSRVPVYRMRTDVGQYHVRIPWPRVDRKATVDTHYRYDWDAMVPLVPPEHRPRQHKAGAGDPLASCHIVWEADWNSAPRDPALIRHIVGDLWTLLATWDLTELERLVIMGTRG
jgi:hypothetical protein